MKRLFVALVSVEMYQLFEISGHREFEAEQISAGQHYY